MDGYTKAFFTALMWITAVTILYKLAPMLLVLALVGTIIGVLLIGYNNTQKANRQVRRARNNLRQEIARNVEEM